jgi:hypothetical protein
MGWTLLMLRFNSLFEIDNEQGRKAWPLDILSEFVRMDKVRVSKIVTMGDSHLEEER